MSVAGARGRRLGREGGPDRPGSTGGAGKGSAGGKEEPVPKGSACFHSRDTSCGLRGGPGGGGDSQSPEAMF